MTNIPSWDEVERRPRNYFERLVWLHGRKWYMGWFAGASSFLLALISVWVVARIPDMDRAGLIGDLVKAYFLAAGALVGIYSGSNLMIETKHASAVKAMAESKTAEAQQATAEAKGPIIVQDRRVSGTILTPDA